MGIIALLHNLAARPRIYNLIQWCVGHKLISRWVLDRTSRVSPADVVLDLGGGTGLGRAFWPHARRYICLDVDKQKLDGFVAAKIDGSPVLGDATCIPVADESLDVIWCAAVSHHLDDVALQRALAECRRVLRQGGKLVFFDAIWKPFRLPGRLIWRLDRGSHPRKREQLRSAVAEVGRIRCDESWAFLHAYVYIVAEKESAART